MDTVKQNLGVLKTLDVRNIWEHEARDFTPWLAQEENIALLGEAIGLELEVESTEVSVGPYSCLLYTSDAADE